MGRVEFRRPCPPLQAPRLSLHGGQEDLKHALHSIFHHCKWSQYQKLFVQKNFPFLTGRG